MKPARRFLLSSLLSCGVACGENNDDVTRDGAVASDSREEDAGALLPSPQEWMVASGEVSLFVRSVGGREGGPALVLVHGGPGVASDPLRVFERMASPDLRVVTYDQRGVYRSSIPPDFGYQLSHHVADLEAVRVALGVDAMHVLGHSWGGLIAQRYV